MYLKKPILYLIFEYDLITFLTKFSIRGQKIKRSQFELNGNVSLKQKYLKSYEINLKYGLGIQKISDLVCEKK